MYKGQHNASRAAQRGSMSSSRLAVLIYRTMQLRRSGQVQTHSSTDKGMVGMVGLSTRARDDATRLSDRILCNGHLQLMFLCCDQLVHLG